MAPKNNPFEIPEGWVLDTRLKRDGTEIKDTKEIYFLKDGGGLGSTRESTPCSFIRESNTIGTPGSTTRRTSSVATHRRVRNDMQRNIPTTLEMEEFFAQHEQEQQRIFLEKYNFDITSDLPLPGRYEWEQVIP
ncbi:unnamed protein product [Prunus armeniaca]